MIRVHRGEVSFTTTDTGPNGNWLYQGRPFTGVAYTLTPDGNVASEQEFRDGLRWGPSWERYRSGQMYHQAAFVRDVWHGRVREWYEDGRLAEDGEYEYGIALWQKKWDAAGRLTEEYRLTESDPEFESLQQVRRAFGDEGQ